MKNLNKLLIASTIAFASMGVSAELVQLDGIYENSWLTDGDRLVTLDESTGKEWLDLSVTAGLTYSELSERLNTDLLGWRLPSYSEIEKLLIDHTLFSNVTGYDYRGGSLNYNSSRKFIANFTRNDDLEPLAMELAAWIIDPLNSNAKRLTDIYAWKAGSYFKSQILGLDYSDNTSLEATTDASAYTDIGYWLISDGGITLSSINDPLINANNPDAPVNNVSSVPLPSTSLLLGLGLAGFIRKKDKK
jgi:hypothetical protein